MSRIRWLLPLVALLALAGCGKGDTAAAGGEAQPLLIGPENLHVVARERIQSGPVISGTLKPERRAEVRAEIGGTVREVLAEKGDAVEAGAVLARLDDRAIKDARSSAESTRRSAERSAELARRNAQRSDELFKSGSITRQQQEDAWAKAMTTEAELKDAQTRLAQADKQLEYTVVRAPIAGVVAERPIAAGDVVQTGAQLYTLVDPTSMRLEAGVPASQLPQVHIGDAVEFEVRGYPDRRFSGRIERINPMADPVTRQIEIYVALPNRDRQLLGGLYAEGRIAAEVRDALTLPLAAVDNAVASVTLLRLRDDRVEAVTVHLGLRDVPGDRVEVLDGLVAGDRVLLRVGRDIAPGTPVRLLDPAKP